MPVDLLIKRLPDAVAKRLRLRAKGNHRSLQGELLAILKEAASHRDAFTVDDIVLLTRRRGIQSRSTSAAMVREDRKSRPKLRKASSA